jgi:hypothetical protein
MKKEKQIIEDAIIDQDCVAEEELPTNYEELAHKQELEIKELSAKFNKVYGMLLNQNKRNEKLKSISSLCLATINLIQSQLNLLEESLKNITEEGEKGNE